MATIAAWTIFILGFGHIAVGLIMFKKPLTEIARAGFIDQVAGDPMRRLAFWYLIFGPLLIMGGHVAIHAIEANDVQLQRIVGFYLATVGAFGTLALPKSPFIVALLLSPILIASGFGWLS